MEQRKVDRRRTYLGGRIRVAALESWSVDCTVKNISEGGARLALRPLDLVPDTFSLDIPKGMLPGERSARLVWYREGMAGVSFDGLAGEVALEDSAIKDAARLASRIASIVERPSTIPRPYLWLVK